MPGLVGLFLVLERVSKRVVAGQSVWAAAESPSPATGCDSAARNVCQMAVWALRNQMDQVAGKRSLRGNIPRVLGSGLTIPALLI